EKSTKRWWGSRTLTGSAAPAQEDATSGHHAIFGYATRDAVPAAGANWTRLGREMDREPEAHITEWRDNYDSDPSVNLGTGKGWAWSAVYVELKVQ
ncbi:MAG: hypothetical protein OEU32_17735, partial [Acidimicrobiia bacterium]|nr:hypothetical protein [Acidimicrobiia bacterium]